MRSLVLLAAALSACTYISEKQLSAELDRDGDSVPLEVDCDAEDPERSVLVAGFADRDGDGFGGEAIEVCGALDGVTQLPNGGDCDDDDPRVSPVGDEICNGIDDDCDGVFDANDPGLLNGIAYHRDDDGDGIPVNGGDAVVRCEAPSGRAPAPADGIWDCDDSNDAIHSAAPEICDGIDNDCVGGVDDGLPALTSYLDHDGDGYGTNSEVRIGCAVPSGFSLEATDCDDADATVSPAAVESCANAVDEDCDGQVDEDGGAVLRYRDADLDGFSDGHSAMLCQLPDSGWIAVFDPASTDCDDADSAFYPGAPDVPYDGSDNDCGGDDDYDADGDGVRRVPEGTDCDDTTATTYPGAPDLPYDDVDSDCAGDNDEDADGDGFTAATRGGSDCNDLDPHVHPDVLEQFYDGVDQNCDGRDDFDQDEDGYAPDAYAGITTLPTGDCDDLLATTWPGAPDAPYDGVDANCDQRADDDVDGDGHAPVFVTGSVLPNDDCNDTDPTVHGAAEERCNGIDDDCDGTTDEPGASGVDAMQALLDADLDGAPSDQFVSVCAIVPGFVDPSLLSPTDCDDADPTVYPRATESPDDGIDQDCDGPDAVTCHVDGDLDGVGGHHTLIEMSGSCVGAGLSLVDTDCDDADAEVFPGAVEICDDIDQDCDGVADSDLISGRFHDGSVGPLWPGLLEGTAPVDLSAYAEVRICGPGPWSMPGVFTTEALALLGHGAPTPLLDFGPTASVLSSNADGFVMSDLVLQGTGRIPSDPAMVSVNGTASVNLSALAFEGVAGEAAVRLSSADHVYASGLDFFHGSHDQAPLVLDSVVLDAVSVYFVDNHGGTAGGIEANDSHFTVSVAEFEGNTSDTPGGAVDLVGTSELEVDDVVFLANTAPDGGALRVGPQARLSGNGVWRQNTGSDGGAILVHGAADLYGSTFETNAATSGGAVMADRLTVSPSVAVRDSMFTGNTGVRGGAVFLDAASLVMSGVLASHNSASSVGGHVGAREFSQISITGGSLVGGVSSSGGALELDRSVAFLADVTIDGNTATAEGGGISSTDDSSYVSLDGCVVSNNTAYSRAGGVSLEAAHVVANETTFMGNSGEFGGGVEARTFSGWDVEFSGNEAGISGGGLYATDGQCNACTFSHNVASAYDGGGAHLGPEFYIYQGVFTGNTALGSGGGAYGSYVDFSDFYSNAASQGGGLYMPTGTYSEYTGSLYFEDNTAGRGGGRYVQTGSAHEGGSIYVENHAENGGAVFVANGSLDAADCEFEQNSAALGPDYYVGIGGSLDFDLFAPLPEEIGVYSRATSSSHVVPVGSVGVDCGAGGCVCSPGPC